MNRTEAIINLAIKYCRDNTVQWQERYLQYRAGHGDLSEYGGSACNFSARYRVFDAILDSVKELVGSTFENDAELVEMLRIAALTSDATLAMDSMDSATVDILGKEQQKFFDWLGCIDDTMIAQAPVFPYERKLMRSESIKLTKELVYLWKIGRYWVPLAASSVESVFVMTDSLTSDDEQAVRKYLTSAPNQRVFSISEFGDGYEMDIELFDFNLSETYIFDRTMEWIIYGSHEGTIAFGGGRLIDLVRELFSSRQELLNCSDF